MKSSVNAKKDFKAKASVLHWEAMKDHNIFAYL